MHRAMRALRVRPAFMRTFGSTPVAFGDGDRLEQAKQSVASLPDSLQVDNSTKLKMYALYKQATKGRNETKKPGMLNPVVRRHDCWLV